MSNYQPLTLQQANDLYAYDVVAYFQNQQGRTNWPLFPDAAEFFNSDFFAGYRSKYVDDRTAAGHLLDKVSFHVRQMPVGYIIEALYKPSHQFFICNSRARRLPEDTLILRYQNNLKNARRHQDLKDQTRELIRNSSMSDWQYSIVAITDDGSRKKTQIINDILDHTDPTNVLAPLTDYLPIYALGEDPRPETVQQVISLYQKYPYLRGEVEVAQKLIQQSPDSLSAKIYQYIFDHPALQAVAFK